MPINQHTCAGPCTRNARNAWVAHHQAAAQHVDTLLTWIRTPPDQRGAQPVMPAPPTTPIADGDPAFCNRCAKMIRAALTELDDLAALLAAGADGHRGAGRREHKTGPSSKSSPSPSPITDTLDELFGALVEVEDQWREARGYPDRPRRSRGGHARTLTIAWLLDHLDDILRHPASVAFGLAALGWHRRLRALTKSDPMTKSSPIRCPRCKERQVRLEDDGYYKCGACEKLMSQTEHDREYAEQADEHEQQEAHAS